MAPAQLQELLLQLDGVFDLAAVERIREALAVVATGGALRIDLSHVREVHDAGLASLARALRRCGRAAKVVVCGLSRHQVRILRYLGVDLTVLAPRGPMLDDSPTA